MTADIHDMHEYQKRKVQKHIEKLAQAVYPSKKLPQPNDGMRNVNREYGLQTTFAKPTGDLLDTMRSITRCGAGQFDDEPPKGAA